jgi:hypothetical protein
MKIKTAEGFQVNTAKGILCCKLPQTYVLILFICNVICRTWGPYTSIIDQYVNGTLSL